MWLCDEGFGEFASSFAPFRGSEMASLTDEEISELRSLPIPRAVRRALLAAVAERG